MSETTAPHRRAPRRRRAVAAVGGFVLVATAATLAAIGFGGSSTDPPSAADLPPDTAQVTRQTMKDTDEVPGDLGYGAMTTLAGRLTGTITKVPLAGDVISRGQSIYRVNNTPVVLMYGEVAAYRLLRPGDAGPDVKQVEGNLAAQGYSGITVDQKYTAATAQAVRNWQKARGLPQTGQVELGRVLFAPGPIRVDSITTGVNELTGQGQEVLKYTGTARQVTVRLDVSKQRLARKRVEVQIQLPDGKRVTGRVERIYSVIQQAADPDGVDETKIETIVSLSDPRAVTGIETAVVNVVFTAAERNDVLTVPIAALVALAEGGYGVEVVEGSSTRYIKVETGLFANGLVEVSGDELREGMTVGVPR